MLYNTICRQTQGIEDFGWTEFYGEWIHSHWVKKVQTITAICIYMYIPRTVEPGNWCHDAWVKAFVMGLWLRLLSWSRNKPISRNYKRKSIKLSLWTCICSNTWRSLPSDCILVLDSRGFQLTAQHCWGLWSLMTHNSQPQRCKPGLRQQPPRLPRHLHPSGHFFWFLRDSAQKSPAGCDNVYW